MNFIQQAYKGEFAIWKYLIPVLGFFGLMTINYFFMIYMEEHMNLKVDEMLRQQIEENGANSVFFQNLVIFVVFLSGLFFWVKYVHKQSITSFTTSREKVDWKRVFFAFFFWGIVSSAIVLLGYFLAPEDFVWNFNLKPFLILAIIALLLVPIQTSFEEYFFRSYLMQALGILSKSRWFPLIMTSVIFGLLHGANPEVNKLGPIIMIYYIGTGLFLGIVTLMDEGLELALGFHAANNLFTVLLVTADWTVFQTDSILRDTSEPSAGVDILVPVLVIFPIVLLVFAKKYGWTNWKEKLFGKVEEVVENN